MLSVDGQCLIPRHRCQHCVAIDPKALIANPRSQDLERTYHLTKTKSGSTEWVLQTCGQNVWGVETNHNTSCWLPSIESWRISFCLLSGAILASLLGSQPLALRQWPVADWFWTSETHPTIGDRNGQNLFLSPDITKSTSRLLILPLLRRPAEVAEASRDRCVILGPRLLGPCFNLVG